MDKIHIKHLLAVELLRQELGRSVESFVSIAKNSIPTAGSHTAPLSAMNETEVFKSLKGIVKHKSGGFTLKTDIVNIRFWPSEFYRQYAQALKDGPNIMARLRG